MQYCGEWVNHARTLIFGVGGTRRPADILETKNNKVNLKIFFLIAYCVDGSCIASISLSSVSGADVLVGDDVKLDVLKKLIDIKFFFFFSFFFLL